MSGENLLLGAGSVSHEQAVDKATTEYKKYQQKTLSEVEKNYLGSLKMLDEKLKRKNYDNTRHLYDYKPLAPLEPAEP